MFKSHPSRCSHCVRKFNSLTVNMYSPCSQIKIPPVEMFSLCSQVQFSHRQYVFACSQVKFPSVEMFSRFSQVQLSPRRYVLTVFASSILTPSRCAHLGRKFNSHPVEMYPGVYNFDPVEMYSMQILCQ